MRPMVLPFRSRYERPMTKGNEGELLACDAGLFRVVNGQRMFVEPNRATYERLQLDAAADSKERTRRSSWAGRRCI